MPSSVISCLEPGQVGRRRLGVGGEAGDRLELQPVAGEVGERLVADDGRRALARCQAVDVLLVQGLQLGAQRRGVVLVRRCAVGVELDQPVGHGVAEVGHQQRVLPEVRVEVAVVVARLVVLVLVLGGGHELDHVCRVDDLRVGRVGLDGLVDRGLEVVLEHDQVGLREGRGLLDVEGQVVRLGARPGEVGDLPLVARHLTGHPGQRVERGDGRATIPGAVVGPAAAGKEGGRGEGGGEGDRSGGGQHENDSHAD